MDGNIPSGFKSSKFVGMDSSIANSFPTTKIDLSNSLYTNQIDAFPSPSDPDDKLPYSTQINNFPVP
jgi:hypothetical protein